MAYADDVVITRRTKKALAGAVEEFKRAVQDLGLDTNSEKTKYMKTSRQTGERRDIVDLGENVFHSCSTFKYLGGVVTENNNLEVEIKGRMVAGTRCFYALQKALRYKSLSRKPKLLLYKTIIRPVVICGQ
ncbi:uncharacterized protein [Halyomorpha halys]|uniref:uncharacterized protein n=1 Tax=Halyomorpha halys TaxID=286706 RepID=UPI0034D21BBF